MKFITLAIIAALSLFSITTSASTVVVKNNNTAEKAIQDIMQSLPELMPITWSSVAERYRVLVFIDNQCWYCTDIVKNVKKYNDAGLTMSFITVAPPSIRDQVIDDMARVWCSTDKQKSLSDAMAGFLPGNDSSPECSKLIEKQSALADRLEIKVTPVLVVLQNPPHIFVGNVRPDVIIKSIIDK